LSTFTKDLYEISWSLFNLTQADQPWIWTNKKQKAFDALKLTVTSVPVLVSLQNLDIFRVEINSFDFTTRVVLLQQSSIDGK